VRIVVYGAGAVGSFWGAVLATAGYDVRFVARGEQLQALQTSGVHILSSGLGDMIVPAQATGSASGLGPADLVLVCVKAHHTPEILDDLEQIAAEHTVFIALQNGIESDAILAGRFGGQRVLSAVVYVSASVEQPGTVRHVARGVLMLGNPYGVPSDRVDRVMEVLNAPGLRARLATDIERQRWYKLMWNTSFNAVSALTLRSSRSLLQIPAAMREVVAVGRAQGVALSEADIEKSIAETERLPPIRTSMLVDRERGRPMEIEALVGVVVRQGGEAGVPTPVASMLYALLKAVAPPDPAEWG
jgi:2-dehydropantoate 2-reductase